MDLCSIDDAHVHTGTAGVVQEGGMERPSDSLVPTEGEGHIGDSATDLAAWADMLDDLAGSDEVHGIVVVLLHAGADCQDIGVKDHILRVESHLLHHDLKCSLANPDLLKRNIFTFMTNKKTKPILILAYAMVTLDNANFKFELVQIDGVQPLQNLDGKSSNKAQICNKESARSDTSETILHTLCKTEQRLERCTWNQI